MKPVALEELFAGLEALVRQEAAQERVEVAWAPEGLTVRADGALLRRALLNLVINALKACAPGGRVTVSAQRGARGVYIAVEDDGVGIAPEDLEKVSSPYFSRFESGTGLGLSIVDQVARAHGWRLEIASEPGRGTRVTLGPADPGS